MPYAMALGLRQLTLFAAFAAAALLLALAASPAAPAASADACQRWGDKQPKEITTGQARKATLCFTNRERASRGLKKLDRNKKLQQAAQRHTDKMHGTGCFSHECPGEGDLTARLRDMNYLTDGLTRWMYAENVAWGAGNHGTPRSIVDAWMKSPGHRANILNGDFRDAGVGVAPGTPTAKQASGGVYTLDFGLAVG
jgi:uncharacterized protein YkwD